MITVSNGVLTVIEACDKVRVTKGKHSYHADVSGAAGLPLPFGDGVYTVDMLEQTRPGYYRILKTRVLQATSANGYMLAPNQYVPCTPAWDFARLEAGDKTGMAAYKAIRKWVSKSIAYDYVKAATVPKKGVIPDPLTVWQTHLGICQDIASLMVGMLRAVGVPSRLVIGRANGRLHAWVEAVIDQKVYRYDPSGGSGSYTRERWY